jgi:transposase
MLNPQGKIYVVLEKVDMRKSINGLSIRISVQYEKNPGDGDCYIFSNGKDKIKVLYFDKNGFVLHYKRFEKCRVNITESSGDMLVINSLELQALLAGLGIKKLQIPHEARYEIF